ncbi:MAG TPA: glycosyltransferase family 2 protein, partial [Bacteroidia bacterium]|nr:glycosyltransferase family 2 protein [Bacteroidia bacterium]
MSTVSVIIPTWNRAHTLGAAVKSVLEQTHPVLEILVCDDGSTDHTEQVLASFNDPRIRIVKGPRAGRPAVPRNRGIAEATGDWVAFLDSDDTWLPTKTEKQLNALSHAHAMIACCNAWKV